MARIHLTLLSVLLYCVTYIYAAATVNSIAGPVAQGATVFITYQFTSPPPAGSNVTLQVINFTTKDTKFLSQNLPISPASFQWVVDVPVGTYYLAINDGTGQAFSGNFEVSPGTLPPSTSAAAPPATTPAAPAPAPSTTPAAPAASATTPTAAPAASSPASSSASSTTSAPAATESKPSAANSSPSFSGYSLLISLAVVAAVMFHMA